MLQIKQGLAAVTRVALSVLLVATMFGIFPNDTQQAYAAEGDNLSFELVAVSNTVDDTTTITYNLREVVVSDATTYQSIMVSFPSSLTIHQSTPQGWTLTSDTSGTIATYSYVVGSPATQGTATQVTNFLNSLSFSTTTAPDGSAGIKVSISQNKMSSFVDENENEHFYEVVTSTSNVQWMDAYNAAKQKTYRGMRGYLATITSQEEQNMIYRTITSKTAWLGGTRMLMATSSGSGVYRQIADDDSVLPWASLTGSTRNQNTAYSANYDFRVANTPVWYWANGPETGQVFYDSATYGTTNNASNTAHYNSTASGARPTYHGEYGFFNAGNTAISDTQGLNNDVDGERLAPAGSVTTGSPNGSSIYSAGAVEPNNSSPTGAAGGEYVLQFAYSNRPTWNDFPYNGAVQNYIVEYGGYSPADIGNGKHPLPDVNEHEELPPVPVTVHYASRLSPDTPLTGLKTIQLTGNKVGDPFVAEPLDIEGYTFVGFDASSNNTDPVAVYHEGSYTWTDAEGTQHTRDHVVVGQISGWVQDITFLYQPKSSTVTFHPNYKEDDPDYWEGLGTVAPQTKTVTYDADYGTLATASREGYTLAGWSLTPDGSEPVASTTTVKQASDHVLYAMWQPKTGYGVRYDLNGGTLTIAGTDYTTATLPDKTKVGWDDAGLLSGTPGSLGGDYDNQASPGWDNPVRDYYFFTGWYVSLNGAGSDITNSQVYGDLAANDRNAFIELRAQWSRDETFAVKYQLNGGTIDGQAAIPNKNDLSVDDNALTPEADPVQPGYQFQGWKLVKRGTVEVTDGAIVTSQDTYGQISPVQPDDRTITLEAQWAPQSYTVLYDLGGGLIDGSTNVNPKTVLYADRNLTQGLNPTRPDDPNGDSWTFSGWVLAKRGDTDVTTPHNVTAADSYGELAGSDDVGSLTLQAQWAPAIRYMVSYDLNGGTIQDDETYPDKTVGYTEAALLPVSDGGALISPERTGYDFAGWRQLYKNGTLSADTIGQSHQYDWLSESPTDRYVTLQAQWTARTGFTVTYDLNNPVPGQSTLPDKSVSWESTNLLPTSQQMLGVILPNGQHLAGWKLVEINGNPVTPHEVFNTASYGSLVTDQTDLSITLQAIWEDDTVWTVQYDPNGGTPTNIGSKTLAANTEAVLPPTTIPPRVGYDFDGWTVVENRNAGLLAEYRVTDSDTFANLVAESQYQPFYTIKLQAQWTPKATFTVNYTSSGVAEDPVAGLSPKNNVAWSGESLLPGTTPTWDHHTLVGWKLVSASTGSIIGANLPESYPVGENAFITEGYSYATLANYIHTTYPDLLSVSQPDEIRSVTLQPVWVEEAQYAVDYDLDGGTYNNSSTYPSSRVYWSDEVLPKDNGSAVVPVRPGYTFTGWKVSANASPEAALLTEVTNEPYSYLAVSPGVSFIRLKAQWDANEYTVNYDLNYTDDTHPSDPASYASRTDVGYNQANLFPVNPSQNPKRVGSGYAFAGWYTAADDSGTRVEAATAYRDLVDDDSVESVTLYAHWMNSSATVAFDKNNSDAGSTEASPASTTVNMEEPYGGAPTGGVYPNPLPTGNNAPSRIGYTFSGWYTAPVNGTRVYDDTIVSIAGNHTLYARWTPLNGYEVRYNYQDVPGNLATPQTPLKAPLAWNATQLLPTEPTRTGWTFDGWWTKPGGQAGGGTEVTNATQYGALTVNDQGVANDQMMSVTIYAHWVPKEAYKVVYDLNGADRVNGNSVSDGAAVEPLDGASWLQTGLMPTQTVEKYGYELNGWKLVLRNASPVTSGTVVWTDNNDSVSYADLAETEDVAQLTLQAQWAATDDNTLSFDSNHADASAPPAQMTGLVYDTAVGALPAAGSGAPTLEGYTFAGWDRNPNYFTPGVGTVTENGGTVPVTPDFTSASTVDWVGEKTVYAVWAATDDNTLSFDSNHADASAPPAQMTGLVYDSAVGALPAEGSGAPTLEGYEFAGWAQEAGHFTPGVGTVTENGGTVPVTPDFTSASTVDWVGDRTAYAVWAARTDMTLEFNANGGTSGSTPQKGGLTYDVAVGELPAAGSGAPTRAGYEFVGWDQKANFFTPGVGTVTEDGGTVPVTPDFTSESIANWAPTNKTVYAVWTAKTYTIHYLSGSVTEDETTHEGYWYADAAPTQPFNKVTGWGSQDLSPTTGEKLTEIPSVTGATWETPNLVPPRWLYLDNIGTNAYYFAGWVLVDNSTHEPISGTNIAVPETKLGDLIPDDSGTEITLMGTWTKSYAVFYELAGGSYSGSGYDLSADYYPDRTDLVAFRSTPMKTGYIFAGWQLSMRDAHAVSEGPVYQADDSATYEELAKISDEAIAENVTLRAQWTPRTDMALEFNANGGTAGSTLQKGGLTYDAAVGELPAAGSGAPTRAGYEFVGWDQRPNHFTPGVGTVTEDGGTAPVTPGFTSESIANWAPTNKTVYAVWAATDDNTLSFSANHADASAPPAQMTGLVYDSAVGALPAEGSGAPTLAGYVFVGWDRNPNYFTPGVGTVTADGGTVPVTPDFTSASTVDWVGDRTAYAVWAAVSNELVFDSNGGTGSMANQTFATDQAQALSANTYVRNGYDFAGWATTADGTAAYEDQDTYTYSPDPYAASVTLYAVWTPKKGYEVKYDPDGGTLNSSSVRSNVQWNSTNLVPVNPERIGYSFAGWQLTYRDTTSVVDGAVLTTNDNDTATYGSLAELDTFASVTLTARWIENGSYEVHYNLNGAPGSLENKTVKWTDSGLLPSPAPTYPGHILLGWDVVSNGSKIGVADTDTYDSLAADEHETRIVLQAQWARESSYTVRYDLNGGDTRTPAAQANLGYTATNLLPLPDSESPARAGYTFLGWWYEDANAQVNATTAYSDLVAADVPAITLVAHWEPKVYTVAYDLDDGDPAGTPAYPSGIASTTVNWSSVAGSEFVPGIEPVREGIIAGSDSPSNPGGTPYKYLFLGWSVTRDSGGNPVSALVRDADTYADLAVDENTTTITLKALWLPVPTDSTQPAHYAVVYDVNQADTLNGSNAFEELYLIDSFDDYGNPLNATDLAPARKGYDFAGWDVVRNGFGSNVTNERYSQLAYDEETYYIVLQAQWTPMEFAVYYGANGGQLTSEDHRGGVYWNTNWLLPASDPVREGYSFREWHQVVAFSDSDAVSPFAIGSAVSNNDKYSVLVGGDDGIKAVYLEAMWDRNSYTVSFVDGLGTVLKSDQVLYGDAAVAPPDPQRSGYAFMGWDKAFDKITEDTIITALWQLKPANPPDGNGSNDGGGGNGGNGGNDSGGKPTPLPSGTIYPENQPSSPGGDNEPDEGAAEAADAADKADAVDAPNKSGSPSIPDRGSDNPSPGKEGSDGEAGQPVWSLLNLILLVGSALLALLGFILTRKRAYDEEESQESTTDVADEGAYYGFGYDAQRHDEHRRTTMLATIGKVLAVVITLVLLVVFVLFEDFRNPMAFVDWISPVFIIGFILTIAAFVLARHTRKSEEDKDSGEGYTKNAPVS